jgi:hypothetical protein
MRRKAVTWILIAVGALLILFSNSFQATFLNVKLHEYVASIGALLLVVGTLQFFFDERMRNDLLGDVRAFLEKRDRLGGLGLADVFEDSKQIATLTDELAAVPKV